MTLVDFQGQALERLRQNLHFDAAWWGVAHSSHDIHGSFPYNLPAQYPNFYLAHVSDTDALAEAALATPGQTVRFGPADFAAAPGGGRRAGRGGGRRAGGGGRGAPAL